MIYKLLLALTFFSSCQKLTKVFDSEYNTKINLKNKSDHIKLVFSHNINGETHPCGCNKFPKGGLAQVYGYLTKAREESDVIYVDTGDMLFPSKSIPSYFHSSSSFSAAKILEAQAILDLNLFLPGDQDFALGVDFLNEMTQKHKIDLILTNIQDNAPLKTHKMIKLKKGDNNLVFLALVDPDLFDYKNYFTEPFSSLEKALKNLKSMKKKQIILLSHGGLEFDKVLAQKFPEINVIIGSHSQSFLKEPIRINQTLIVQALSQNHFIGELKIPYSDKKEIEYSLIEMTEDKKKLVSSNPMIDWTENYKVELEKIQKEEQVIQNVNPHSQVKKATYLTCADCHSAQLDFWQKTSHAIAFQTLIQNQASHNPACIKCHSVFYLDDQGFQSSSDIIQGDDLNPEQQEKYWKELKENFKDMTSIRETKAHIRQDKAKKWHKIDQKYKITHNYANVQCLNCHDQSDDHPFEINENKKATDYVAKCIQCHSPDQSTDWYIKDPAGLDLVLNKEYVEKKIKEISCPKNE